MIFLFIRRQEDRDLAAARMEFPGDNKTVAAVVAWSAKYGKFLALDAELPLNHRINSFACIFHQDFRRDAVFGGGPFVHPAHFFDAAYFHFCYPLGMGGLFLHPF